MSLFSRSGLFFAFFTFSIIFLQGCATSQSGSNLSKDERARNYLNIANGSMMEGDYRTALEFLIKAEDLDPEIPEIYHARGLVYYFQKNPESAITQIRKAIAIAPKFSDANNSLGKILIDLGRLEAAVKPLESAAADEVYVDRYKPYTNLGILRYRQGRFDESRNFFERATIYGPDIACVAYYYLGHIALRESHFKDAIRKYESATMKFCGGFQDAHFALGIAYEQARDFRQARKKFLEVQNRFPNTKVAEQAIEHLRDLP